jgi:SspJ family small acid-soluble spore protein
MVKATEETDKEHHAMAARTKKAKKAASSAAASTSPWVQRLVEDEDLRDNFKVAFDAAKDAYDRISDGKGPKALVDDKKVQKDLNKAAGALKDAGTALKDGPKKKPKKRRPFRKLLIAFVLAGAALAISEDLRTKVLDALFGKEEEFEYTSTTTPPAPPAA